MRDQDRDDRARGGRDAGGDPGRGRDRDVGLDRRVGAGGQREALGRLGQQEERAEAAGQLVGALVAGAVEVRRLQAALVELDDAPLRALDELVVGAELDRVGRARLR
jgi:hypothetical protein